MKSFSLNMSAKDRATGRFKSRVNRALVEAVIRAKREKGLTQSQIADRMGVDKSTLSQIVNGRGNLTLRTIGEISWAVGQRPDITFSKIQPASVVRATHPPTPVKTGNEAETLPRSTYTSKTAFNSTKEAVTLRSGSS